MRCALSVSGSNSSTKRLFIPAYLLPVLAVMAGCTTFQPAAPSDPFAYLPENPSVFVDIRCAGSTVDLCGLLTEELAPSAVGVKDIERVLAGVEEVLIAAEFGSTPVRATILLTGRLPLGRIRTAAVFRPQIRREARNRFRIDLGTGEEYLLLMPQSGVLVLTNLSDFRPSVASSADEDLRSAADGAVAFLRVNDRKLIADVLEKIGVPEAVAAKSPITSFEAWLREGTGDTLPARAGFKTNSSIAARLVEAALKVIALGSEKKFTVLRLDSEVWIEELTLSGDDLRAALSLSRGDG